MPQAIPFNPFDLHFKANPYPFYAQLRERAPVQQVTLPDGQVLWPCGTGFSYPPGWSWRCFEGRCWTPSARHGRVRS